MKPVRVAAFRIIALRSLPTLFREPFGRPGPPGLPGLNFPSPSGCPYGFTLAGIAGFMANNSFILGFLKELTTLRSIERGFLFEVGGRGHRLSPPPPAMH